ncbi:unnamed protein product, partial [Polarella glacialis]
AGTAKLYWVSNGNQLVHRHNLDGSGTSESVTSCGKAYYVSVGLYKPLLVSTTTSTSMTGPSATFTTTSITSTTTLTNTATAITSTAILTNNATAITSTATLTNTATSNVSTTTLTNTATSITSTATLTNTTTSISTTATLTATSTTTSTTTRTNTTSTSASQTTTTATNSITFTITTTSTTGQTSTILTTPMSTQSLTSTTTHTTTITTTTKTTMIAVTSSVSNISSNSTMFTTVTTSTSAVSAALPPLGSAAGGYASTTSFDAAASTSTSAPAAQAGGAAPASSGRSSTSGPPGPLAKKALLVGPTEPESKNEERVNFTQIFLLGILGSLLVLALAYVLRRWLRRRHAKVQAEETGRVQQDPTKRVQEEDDEEGLRLSSRPENQNSGAKLALDLQENLVPGGGVGSNDWKSVLSSPRTSFPRKKTEAGSLHFLEPESPKSEDAMDNMVSQAGDELLHDFEELFESSKAQTGKDLRPELGSILDGWRKRQLASTGGVDDITASLISGMAESAQDVVLRHAGAGSNFSQLKPHIEDGWRQRMATERLVHKAGDELLHDLEQLFESSKAQTGKDLRPELGSILDGWRKRQLASTGGVDDITASLISGMAESAQDVVLRHAGAGSNFSQLKPHIEDGWRQRM